MERKGYSLNVGGRLLDLSVPCVMGIMNVTPDSFYAGSRVQQEQDVARRLQTMLAEGAGMVDIGGCSTRPGSTPVDEAEEMNRLRWCLETVRREGGKDVIVSVDTFRASVARMCVEQYGVQMVNDVSGGADTQMFPTVAELGVPYVLTLTAPLDRDSLRRLSEQVATLHSLGQKDIVIDPGFGFGKTLEENYFLLHHLESLRMLDLPLLVGVSRKSMVTKVLDCTPDDALNGTTVLHTMCLTKGCADILRVHDVRACADIIKIVSAWRVKI